MHVSTVLVYHAVFSVNSLCHLFGRRRYATPDQSRNNVWVAVATLGEGWHNNHHHYQSSTNQGFFWWEVDVSYRLIRLLECLGLVWGTRTPPHAVLLAGDGEASSVRPHTLPAEAAPVANRGAGDPRPGAGRGSPGASPVPMPTRDVPPGMGGSEGDGAAPWHPGGVGPARDRATSQ